jgi:predicted alpha/beta-hydrolase family hydrolase
MAARRSGERKPPPRAETLNPEYVAAVDALGPTTGPLIVGGKSMGGRVASMVADELFAAGRIAGLLCLGYPFHPPGRPTQLRTAHLAGLKTPALIVQGTRDEFGTREDVAGYELSPAIGLKWLEDGDHDLKPRRKVSGFSAADHLKTMAEAVLGWSKRITGEL